MSLVIFSNSEYYFLWPIIEESVSKINFHKIFVSDINDLDKPQGFDQYIYYNTNHCYAKRWTHDILPNIASDYILVVHDVQIIVSFDEEFILNNLKLMSEYSIDRCSLNVFIGNEIIEKYSIKLCKLNTAHGDTFTPYDVCPAIWKRQSFKILFDTFPDETYRSSELNNNLQIFCRNNFLCVGLQKTSDTIYRCIGRPYLNYFKILHITLKKELLSPNDVYMDMKPEFIYYANKYRVYDFVKINNNASYILTIPSSL